MVRSRFFSYTVSATSMIEDFQILDFLAPSS